MSTLEYAWYEANEPIFKCRDNSLGKIIGNIVIIKEIACGVPDEGETTFAYSKFDSNGKKINKEYVYGI